MDKRKVPQWTTTPPSKDGYYWWREDSDTASTVVLVERSGHKPPYWFSWGLCNGCNGEAPDMMDLDINFDGSGPVEEFYRTGNIFRGGEWWPIRIEEPPSNKELQNE